MATSTVPILIGGIFAWSIYRRVKRNIGKQKLKPVRSVISIVIFLAFSFLILKFARNGEMLFSFGGGLLAGAILGLIGLRLTKFETTDEGHFYTPNTYIGGALTALFIGRMLYRYWQRQPDASNQPAWGQSPLTYLIIGLTFGYYLVYYIGLFVHTHDKKPPVA